MKLMHILMLLLIIPSAYAQNYHLILNPEQMQPRNYTEVKKYIPYNETENTKLDIQAGKDIILCINKNQLIMITIIVAIILIASAVIILRKIFWI